MKGIKIRNQFRFVTFWLKNKYFRPAGAFTYVAIGDSTVEGIGASNPQHSYASLVHAGISLHFKRAVHYNFGKGGARVKDVVAEQLDQAIAAQPNLVTISVGANDIVRNTRTSIFRGEFSELITRIRAETKAVIVVTNIPNLALTPAVPKHLKLLAAVRIRRINACIQAVADKHDLVLIDAFNDSSMFMRQFPDKVLHGDGFHPSDFGYALWANTILTVLRDKL